MTQELAALDAPATATRSPSSSGSAPAPAQDAILPAPTEPATPDLADPSLYTNRELSWLEFNERVLSEAFDARNPLLERVRFLAITANNLDEFFMVRVSGLRQQVRARVKGLSPDGMSAREQLDAVDRRTRDMLADMARCFTEVLSPLLTAEGLAIRHWGEIDDESQARLSEFFREQIFPVLTPLAVDPAHPFPYISNLSLNLAVSIRDPQEGRDLFARVKVPTTILSRFVPVGASQEVVPIEELVAAHLGMLFPGMEILEYHPFRVIRDADIDIEEDEAQDLLDEIESSLRQRRFRSVVSLAVAPTMPLEVRELLARELEVGSTEVVEVPGVLGLADLTDLADVDRPDLFFAPWKPQVPPVFVDSEGGRADIFALLRKSDVLVHHPYESFSASIEAFILQAVDDPDVLAIKQTMYRTGENSEIMRGLIRAAESGKQVVVVVEIKARFDEERNIQWARQLEAAGAHVVYGLVGLKTHAKTCLVVRHEKDGIRRYLHIGTGNYNASTARLYEDLGILSCEPLLGADDSDLFNFLTGYSRQREFRRLLVAPYGLRDALERRIERESEHARAGRAARITMKMNSLVDPRMVRLLYEASQAGVEVDLVVRGICCLKPGIPGVSENIRVRSVIGRFLEHSRIFHFHNDGHDEYLIGSADLMPRNLDRRVEADVPVEVPALQRKLREILEVNLADNRQAWLLHPDDSWEQLVAADGEPELSTHVELMRRALEGR